MATYEVDVKQVGPAAWLWIVYAPEAHELAPRLRKSICPTRSQADLEVKQWIDWLHEGPARGMRYTIER